VVGVENETVRVPIDPAQVARVVVYETLHAWHHAVRAGAPLALFCRESLDQLNVWPQARRPVDAGALPDDVIATVSHPDSDIEYSQVTDALRHCGSLAQMV